jgi:hypothetical protein
MAAIAKAGVPSACSTNPEPHRLPTIVCGEDIGAGDVVAMHADGLAYKSVAGDGYTKLGIAWVAANTGDPVTPTIGLRFSYGSGMTPGAKVWGSATAGALSTTAVNSETVALGFAWDATRIQFYDRLN